LNWGFCYPIDLLTTICYWSLGAPIAIDSLSVNVGSNVPNAVPVPIPAPPVDNAMPGPSGLNSNIPGSSRVNANSGRRGARGGMGRGRRGRGRGQIMSTNQRQITGKKIYICSLFHVMEE
jgi:hypothetical protein